VEPQQPPSSQPGTDAAGKGGTPIVVRASVRFVLAVVFYGAIFFVTAGTFDYWEAWLFMAVLFLPIGLLIIYTARVAPDLLERRMKAREERTRQKGIVRLWTLTWLVMFVLPGLDHRFGWSSVPTWLVICSALLTLASYLFVIRVMLENRYASRTIGVEEGQELVTTGLYAIVRHPMYLGILPMVVAMPLALGSFWAVLPSLLTPLFLVLRILDEEEALTDGLPGYREYMEKTTSRMIPGVW
jgi:protein-S-isoprenylcysteine O-methyltransferase Ste14